MRYLMASVMLFVVLTMSACGGDTVIVPGPKGDKGDKGDSVIVVPSEH